MEGVPASNAAGRNALHDAQPLRIPFNQLQPFLLGRIDLEKWFVGMLRILEPRRLVLHRILLSTDGFGGIRIAGAWYTVPSGMSSADIVMPAQID